MLEKCFPMYFGRGTNQSAILEQLNSQISSTPKAIKCGGGAVGGLSKY